MFIPPELAREFESALDHLNSARIEQHMNLRPDRSTKATPKQSMLLLGPDGAQMFEHLRDAVRDRLLRSLLQASSR